MSERNSVSGSLQISDGLRGLGEPLDVRVSVERDRGGEIMLWVVLETGTQWLLEFDPAAAAYLAGHMAMQAGVIFG